MNVVISPTLLVLLALAAALPPTMAALQVTATTPGPIDASNPTVNTFVASADSFAASLLASVSPGAAIMLWGSVSSSSIRDACDQIVNTGTHQIDASITGSDNGGWGAGTFDTTLTLVATGGCNAAADNSGTQFVFDDSNGRRIAVVCPDNAGSTGCGVYWTGDDVKAVYNSVAGQSNQSGRKMLGRELLDDAQDGCVNTIKDIGGDCAAGTLLEGTALCLLLGPFAPLCGLGAFGACIGLACGVGAADASGCFPGHAEVLLKSGQSLPMSDLRVGDKVAVMDNRGAVKYDAVYAFGHNDPLPLSSFVELSTSTRTLQLSALHFIPTASGNASSMVYKRAQEVILGDYVWEASSAEGSLQKVTGRATSASRGLYNPLTMSGNIIVNGIVASVHSDWFLDSIFDALHIPAWLPAAYQAVLFPARLLYVILGKALYMQAYEFLDTHLGSGGIAEFGTVHGGAIVAGSTCALASALAVMVATSQYSKKLGVSETRKVA